MGRLITAGNREWPRDCWFPGPPRVADKMHRIAELTDKEPKRAIRAAKSLVRYCEDEADIDNETLREARNLLTDAENALAKQK